MDSINIELVITNCIYKKQIDNLYSDCSVFCKIRVFILLSHIAVMYISPANFIKVIFVKVKSCMILKCENNYRTKTATFIDKIISKNMKLFVTICKILFIVSLFHIMQN